MKSLSAERVRDLLPWYAAGALSAEETAAVTRQLKDSPALQRELEQYQVLREVVRQPGEEPTLSPDAIQGAWTRISGYERDKARRGHFWRQWRERLSLDWLAMPTGGRLVLAGQLVLILALVGVLTVRSEREPGFSTLSGPSATAGAGAELTVMFVPSASEANLRAALAEIDAQIVAGPSGQGSYALHLAEHTPAGVAAAAARLRAHTDLVRFVAEGDQR